MDIIIKREKQLITGISKIKIFADDEYLFSLKQGQSEKIAISKTKGIKLKAKYLWLSSELKIDDTKMSAINLKLKFFMENRTFVLFGVIINLLVITAVLTSFHIYTMLALNLIVALFVYNSSLRKNSLILGYE